MPCVGYHTVLNVIYIKQKKTNLNGFKDEFET